MNSETIFLEFCNNLLETVGKYASNFSNNDVCMHKLISDLALLKVDPVKTRARLIRSMAHRGTEVTYGRSTVKRFLDAFPFSGFANVLSP